MTDAFAAMGPELQAKLADVVARNRLPGAVADVVHRNELAWSATIGLADVIAGQQHLLRPAVPGRRDRPVQRRAIRQHHRAGHQPCGTACAVGPAQVPETGPAANAVPGACQPLLGLYARPGLIHVVRAEWRDGRLAVAGPEPDGWRLALSQTSDPDVFTADLDSPQAGEQVRFHRTADGRVRAISLFDATFARLDPVGTG